MYETLMKWVLEHTQNVVKTVVFNFVQPYFHNLMRWYANIVIAKHYDIPRIHKNQWLESDKV